jgi:uncharacterized Fe-S cluster-containing MiaB family protein
MPVTAAVGLRRAFVLEATEVFIATSTRDSSTSSSEERDLSRPQHYWFYEDAGESVHVTFLTRPCRRQDCPMCSLRNMSDTRVQFRHLIEQVDFFCERVLAPHDLRKLETITVGNNGSILDPHTFPPSVLFYILARVRLLCPRLRRLSLITRPEYATDSILGCLVNEALTYYADGPPALQRSLSFEIAVALDAVSPTTKDAVANGIGRAEIEGLMERLRHWNNFSKTQTQRPEPPQFSFRGYVLLKGCPPIGPEAIRNVVEGMNSLAEMQRAFEIHTVMQLSMGALTDDMREETHPLNTESLLPTRDLIGSALLEVRRLWDGTNEKERPSLCLGLSDENKALPRGVFKPPPMGQTDSLSCALFNFNGDTSEGKREAFEAIEAAMGLRPASN